MPKQYLCDLLSRKNCISIIKDVAAENGHFMDMETLDSEYEMNCIFLNYLKKINNNGSPPFSNPCHCYSSLMGYGVGSLQYLCALVEISHSLRTM